MKLHVILDPSDRIVVDSPDNRADFARHGVKTASLSIAEDLDHRDISALARRLAEMLLEQAR